MTTPTKRVALVGCGRIGAPVMAALLGGQLPGWTLCGVLVRRPGSDRGPLFTTSAEALLATRPDLVLDTAGPVALAELGETLLRAADVWTISAAALADDGLLRRLEAVGSESGHRLRVLPGAMAGLDGVATIAAAPGSTLQLTVELRPGAGPAGHRFSGSVRDAARRFPNDVNVAVAAALAGPGLDATQVDVHHAGPQPRHRLALRSHGSVGTLEVEVLPELSEVHPVACSIVAALRRETLTVWVG